MSAAGERFWTRETKALVALVVVIVLLALFAGGGPGSSRSGLEKASTFLTDDAGAAALFLAAGELSLSPNRWMLPFPEDASNDKSPPRVLAIVAPDEPLLASEARWLREWIEHGGFLLYVASRDEHDEVLKALGLELNAQRWGDAFPAQPDSPKSTLGMRLLEGTPPSVTGFRSTMASVGGGPSVESLLSDKAGRMVAALLGFERGRALVVADAGPLVNGHLRDSGLAPLILRALADASQGNPVWFDEFHHGYDERASPTLATWRFLKGTHAGWALVEIAILSLLALVFAGIRVGRAVAVTPSPHRSSLEHVNALAAAYRESSATRRPAALLVDGLRVRVGARSREELMQWLEGVAVAHPALRAEAEQLAIQARRPASDADLVALTKSIDRVLEEESRVGTN